MKFLDLKNMTTAELRKKLVELREERFQLKMKNVLGQVEDFSKIKLLRRDVARVQTALKSKSVQ